jgi:hypothetical protein
LGEKGKVFFPGIRNTFTTSPWIRLNLAAPRVWAKPDEDVDNQKPKITPVIKTNFFMIKHLLPKQSFWLLIHVKRKGQKKITGRAARILAALNKTSRSQTGLCARAPVSAALKRC